MRTSRPKRILWLASLALGAALIGLLVTSREPRYQGRSLTDWLVQAQQNNNKPAEFEAARKAVLSIGTNAIPYLLKWTEYPKPGVASRIRELLQAARRYPVGRQCVPEWLTLDMKFERFMVAPLGFSILGRTAASAVPELSGKLHSAPDWLTAKLCLDDLQAIDPQGIPRLCAVITNPPPKGWSIPPPAMPPPPGFSLRVVAISYLFRMGTNAAPALPALVQAINDNELDVAEHAVLALGLTGSGQAITVPALTHALQDPRARIRAAAADALSRLQAEARPAVPALLKALADEDPKVREWTTNALVEIAPEVFTNAPVK